MDRRSPVLRPGVRGTDAISSANWLANDGSDPATDPDVVLSRRNKPITDLIGLGLESPPNFFAIDFVCCCGQCRDDACVVVVVVVFDLMLICMLCCFVHSFFLFLEGKKE